MADLEKKKSQKFSVTLQLHAQQMTGLQISYTVTKMLKRHIEKSRSDNMTITELVKQPSACLAPYFYYSYKHKRINGLYLYIVSAKTDLLHIIPLIQNYKILAA
jgi:hypothetical protein